MADSLCVDVTPLLHELGATIHLSGELDLSSYEVGEASYAPVAPPKYSVDITNTGSAVIARGTISADVRMACSRCLEEFVSRLDGEVEGVFVEEGANAEGFEEEELEPIDRDGMIDLFPALHAALVFSTPFVVLCNEECKGLCPHCGANLNLTDCSCEDDIDPLNPFSQLKDLEL